MIIYNLMTAYPDELKPNVKIIYQINQSLEIHNNYILNLSYNYSKFIFF